MLKRFLQNKGLIALTTAQPSIFNQNLARFSLYQKKSQSSSTLFTTSKQSFHTHTKDCNHDHDPPTEEAEVINSNFGEMYDDSSYTPFDDDYFMADKVPDSEQDAIMGIHEYEKAIQFFHDKKYDESEHYLKEVLRILKGAKQEETQGYLYVLRKLAYVCFVSRKFSESEKYFKVVTDLVSKVTKNPANVFSAQKNLLLFYTHTDINKARELGQRMFVDSDDFLPIHNKELNFLLGNINFLSGDFGAAKSLYRNTLKLSPQPKLEAMILNNLAFTQWMSVMDLPKLKEQEGMTEEEFDKQTKLILNEEKYTMSYLLQSIEISEKAQNQNLNLTLLERVITQDLTDKDTAD